MVRKSLARILVLVVSSFVFGILVMALFTFVSKTNASASDALEPENNVGSFNALTQSKIGCTPVFVAVFGNRVHVECAAAVGGIKFFAVSTSNTAHAARILSTASTAQVAGRNLLIWYDPANTSGTSFGCGAGDCRTIDGLAFGN
jgi:hypothetical protein